MEFENEFTVPTDIETTWATLTDLEKVAPCLPGATLEEVDGDTYTGRVKIKVGPITVTYRGTARLAEADEERRFARIDANGKESRGSGTASADVTAQLTETDEGTKVHVVTDLNVTGKPAQFGRGVMEEVGTKIIGTFAERLEAMVTGGDEEDAEPTGTEASQDTPSETGASEASGGEAKATGAADAGPRKIAQDPARADDALDLMEVAGAATAKRLVPVIVGAAVVALIIWLIRRR